MFKHQIIDWSQWLLPWHTGYFKYSGNCGSPWDFQARVYRVYTNWSDMRNRWKCRAAKKALRKIADWIKLTGRLWLFKHYLQQPQAKKHLRRHKTNPEVNGVQKQKTTIGSTSTGQFGWTWAQSSLTFLLLTNNIRIWCVLQFKSIHLKAERIVQVVILSCCSLPVSMTQSGHSLLTSPITTSSRIVTVDFFLNISLCMKIPDDQQFLKKHRPAPATMSL